MTGKKIKDVDLKDLTIKYNGVQFGGGDAAFTMMPPTYALQGEYVYDEAGRAVTHVKYLLRLSTTVFESDEHTLSLNSDALRQRLAEPGKQLELKGIGIGWNSRDPRDLVWGVKPRYVSMVPVGGNLAWQWNWAVEFNVSECSSLTASPFTFMAFNYSTVWNYTTEGKAIRTIKGYVTLPQPREYKTPDKVTKVADDLREKITVAVPPGFQRVGWNIAENADKQRLDFTYTDREFDDEVYPPGITLASGSFRMDTTGAGMATGRATLNLSLTTAPHVPKQLAGMVAMQMALAHQDHMVGTADEENDRKMTIIPDGMSWSRQLWSRQSQFAFTWKLRGCVGDFIMQSGVWVPAPGGDDYDAWKTSMDRLWVARGTAGLRSLPSNDLIIHVCRAVTTADIGHTPAVDVKEDLPEQFEWPCPDITEENSWLRYDVDARVERTRPLTQHRLAADGAPQDDDPPPTEPDDVEPDDPTKLPGGDRTIPEGEEHETEFSGHGYTRVLLQFTGVRIKYKPVPPVLDRIGDQTASPADEAMTNQKLVGCLLGCPVYMLQSSQWYIVSGNVNEITNEDRGNMKDRSQCCEDEENNPPGDE